MNNLKNKIEKLIDTSKYDEACELVRNEFDFNFECKFLKDDFHFYKDESTRDIYEVTLKRGTREYTFNFGQSINDSGFYYTVGKRKTKLDRKYLEKGYFKGKPLGLIGTIKMQDHSFTPTVSSDIIHYPKEPTLYDILACSTKYDPGTFEDFCSEFGYDEDSKSAEKTYNAVVKEYEGMCRLFSDEELEVLQLIS